MKKTLGSLYCELSLLGLSVIGLHVVAPAYANENPSDENRQVADNDSLREYFDDEMGSEISESKKFAQATEVGATPAGAAAGSPAGAGAAAGSPADAGAAAGSPADAGVKKKKTKKKSGATEAQFGHGLQESGLPYTANVEIGFQFNKSSKTKKYSDNSSQSSSTAISLGIGYLRVLGPIEVGPLVSFLSQTDTSPNSATPTENDVSKTSALGLGLGFAFNIGNIHQNAMVPYIGLGVLKNSTTTVFSTTGATDTTTVTSSELNLDVDLGLKIFMGGHIALKPFVNYTILMSGESKEEITGADTVVGSVTGNTISLGLGLAKYF